MKNGQNKSDWRRAPRCRVRRGIATIELVMFFPILVWLAAMIFALGFAHLQKSSGIIRSREQAWSLRLPTNPDDPGFAKKVLLRKEVGQNQYTETVKREARIPNVPGVRNAGGVVVGESKNMLIMGPWPDENPRVGLRESVGGHRPHVRPLRPLLESQGAPTGGIEAVLSSTDALLRTLQFGQIEGLPKKYMLMGSSFELGTTYARSFKYYGESGAALLFPDYPLHPPAMIMEAGEMRTLFDEF